MKKWTLALRKLSYILVVLLGIFSVCSAKANPAPFGFELLKATSADIKDKYSILRKEKNSYGGYSYYVAGRDLPLEGLLEACFATDQEQIVQGVLLTMHKSRFDSMFESLSKKYEVVSKDIPFVGSKEVKFENDDSLIIMEAPHLSFEMSIIYGTKKFFDAAVDASRKEEQEKKAKEESVL